MSAPLYYTATGAGVVTARSGPEKDATQIFFQAGPLVESHQDRATGAFLIFRGEWLAASAKLPSQSGLAQNVEDHNCVQFSGQQQQFGQTTAGLRAQEDTAAYTLLSAELLPAYAGQVAAYTRSLFFLKPNYLLVLDQFVTTLSPVFHLHALDQPTSDAAGFAGQSSAGTRLFGTAALNAWTKRQINPAQTWPSWRLDLAPDAQGGFCVALETAPAAQTARTIAAFNPPGLRGAVLGSALAGCVTGPLPLTYPSPVAGPHYLLGLPPRAAYAVPGGGVTRTSAAGVLAFTGPAVGRPVTIGGTGPPPPPPPPPAGRKFIVVVPATGAPTIEEMP